jgi:enoyl-CoA hydratase/carnithine racemase
MTINRESRRNAISQEMITSFMDYMDQAEKDEGVRAACVTAVGEKAFCSGADLGGTLTTEGSDRLSGPRNHAELLKRFARFGRPVVARVNGPCLAGGLGLMLSCDIAIARDDVFFCTPEVNVGIFPMMVGALIYRNVSRKKAVEMVLPGRKIPAPEAEQMGLTTRAVEPGRLDEEVHKTLVLLKSKSPLGMKIGKDAFRIMSDMPFDEGVDYLSEALVRIMATEDAAEGMKAFLEKRTPDFKGR